jgi:GST-like protein
MAKYRLFGRPGWGSVIVEAQLAALGMPFDFEEVPNLFESEDARLRGVWERNFSEASGS